MKILIVGSKQKHWAERQSERFRSACRELGEKLVMAGHTIVIGSARKRTADRFIVEGANSIPGVHEVFIVYSASDRGIPFEGEYARLGHISFKYEGVDLPWWAARSHQVAAADAVILIGGSRSTRQVGLEAPRLGKPVLAIPAFGGASEGLWSELKPVYDQFDLLAEDFRVLGEQWGSLSADSAVRIIEELVRHNPYRSDDGAPQVPRTSAAGDSLTIKKPTIFISYSHEDEAEKDQLISHLKPLEKYGLVQLWVDDRIGGGEDWKREIEQAIAQSSIAVLLITKDFLSSDFIQGKEVPSFLQRRKEGGLRVFPVIAKPTVWKYVPWLREMNVRPKNGKPVWRKGGKHVDKELAAIAEEIADIVKTNL